MDDTYNGWKNRETWALCLHLGNDQGLYYMVRDRTAEAVEEYTRRMTDLKLPESDKGRASSVGNYILTEVQAFADDEASEGWDEVRMMVREVGSWWRVDAAEVGAWALDA